MQVVVVSVPCVLLPWCLFGRLSAIIQRDGGAFVRAGFRHWEGRVHRLEVEGGPLLYTLSIVDPSLL